MTPPAPPPVNPSPQPTWRKPAGVFMMIALITALAVLIGSFSTWLATLPFVVQMLVYAVAGVIWIAPMGPLLLWMETGRWRV